MLTLRRSRTRRLAKARLRSARADLEAADAHLELVALNDRFNRPHEDESREFLEANEAAWKAREALDRAAAHAKAPPGRDSM